MNYTWPREAQELHKPEPKAQSTTGTALVITGDLDADAPVRINGVIEGNVRGTIVIIGRTASVKGSIHAEQVQIAGHVDGFINAKVVIITRHAHVAGSVICENLCVGPGAYIYAHCTVWRSDR